MLEARPAAAQRHMEELTATGTDEYESNFARQYYGQGTTEGRTEAVLDVLTARGIPVTDAERARIVECTDLDRIGVWLRLAATTRSIDELFAAQA